MKWNKNRWLFAEKKCWREYVLSLFYFMISEIYIKYMDNYQIEARRKRKIEEEAKRNDELKKAVELVRKKKIEIKLNRLSDIAGLVKLYLLFFSFFCINVKIFYILNLNWFIDYLYHLKMIYTQKNLQKLLVCIIIFASQTSRIFRTSCCQKVCIIYLSFLRNA